MKMGFGLSVYLFFPLCLSVFGACQQAEHATSMRPASDPKEAASVRKTLTEIIAADNAADIDRVVALYADDALLMPPNLPAVRGKAAIGDRYRQGFEKARMEVSSYSEETQVSGEWAFDRGLTRGMNVWRDGRPPTKFEHKYLMLLKRQPDGAWKIARLIWNNNATEIREVE